MKFVKDNTFILNLLFKFQYKYQVKQVGTLMKP